MPVLSESKPSLGEKTSEKIMYKPPHPELSGENENKLSMYSIYLFLQGYGVVMGLMSEDKGEAEEK